MKRKSLSPNASPQGPHLKCMNSLEKGFIGRDCLGNLSQSQHGVDFDRETSPKGKIFGEAE